MPRAVKRYAQKNPHSMAAWNPASRTHVSHMRAGDFYHGEKSMTLSHGCEVRMDLVTRSGKTLVLRPAVPLLEGEVIDSMYMSKKALCAFFESELEHCKKHDLLFSLHVKATMMKVSHPIVFGHAVRVFYKDLFEKHGKLFAELGVIVNNGFANVLEKIKALPDAKRAEIEADIKACGRAAAPVDGRFGQGDQQPLQPQRRHCGCLDARDDPAGARLWGPDGKCRDQGGAARVHFARIYRGPHFCKTNGAFDPKTWARFRMWTHCATGRRLRSPTRPSKSRRTAWRASSTTRRPRADGAERRVRRHLAHVPDQDAAIRDWSSWRSRARAPSNTPRGVWLDEYRPHETR